MQFVDESGKCKCHGRCMHTYEKRLKKGSTREINCQDGFMFYDAIADCMVYKCGKVSHSLVDSTKLKKGVREVLEENEMIQYIKNTKWAVVTNKSGSCGWQEVIPAYTDKVVVARTTVRKNGKVRFRVSVHPSLGKNLTLDQRRMIGRHNEKKTQAAKLIIEHNRTEKHLEAQLRWARENKKC